MKSKGGEPHTATGGTGKAGLGKLAVPARIHLGTNEVQSELLNNNELENSFKGRGSPLTKVSAKGSSKNKAGLGKHISIEEDSKEHVNDKLAEKVDEKADALQKELDDLNRQTQQKLIEIEKLFKGAGFESLGSNSLESVELRLNRIVSKADKANSKEQEEIDELKYKNDIAANKINKFNKQLEELVKRQQDLKSHVSQKSNEHVDIKPGRTIEDIFVSLRRRGKVLKGQGSSDAPILNAEEKVLLLPERSIRILKEFLVDLKDRDDPRLKQMKEENGLLKETCDHLYNKIKEQHESDKVVGAPGEKQAKERLEDYENMLALSIPKFKSVENNLIDISKEYCTALDKNNILGKEQNKLYIKFLEVRREVTKLNQEANDMNELQSSIKAIGAERYRKKERAVEKQTTILTELNNLIRELSQTNDQLLSIMTEKEAELQKVENECDHIGIKELDHNIDADINGFITSQNERRQFQDESEELPPAWDLRFKGHIQDMSTELKHALNEYPSNKNFPSVSSDWVSATREQADLKCQNKILDRSKAAQSIKVALMRDMDTEIRFIREKLNGKIDETTFLDTLRESRVRLDELRMILKTILVDVKRENLLVTKCMKHRNIDSEDVKNCPECQGLLILIRKINHLDNIIEEADRCNDQKLQSLQEKNDRIEALKEEIEFLEEQNGEDQDLTQAQKLDFLMADQIEASLVPITKLNGVGNYLFGTKKMHVKILENELFVRIGGGYMDINEYLVRYTDSELARTHKQMKKENAKKYEDLNVYKEYVVKEGLHSKRKQPVFLPTLNKSQA